MNLLSATRVALAALVVNKGRSALTSLGIVIGISAVISLVSAGSGARDLLEGRLDTIGKNMILVRPGARNQQGLVVDAVPLSMADAAAIRKALGPAITGAAASYLTQQTVSSVNGLCYTSIVGSEPALERVRRWPVRSGRFFNDDDLKRVAAVCLLGQSVRQKLFPDEPNPVGRSIRLGPLRLRVVGILAAKGRSPTGADQDDQVFLPITTVQRRLIGGDKVNMIISAAAGGHATELVKEQIIQALRRARRLKPDAPNNFDVSSVQEMAQLGEVLASTMQVLVVVLASLSLVVGGIGIMNIMLVSVTERTREIGIRLAVGATPSAILTQFILEALALALAGGLLGIGLGLGGSVLLARLAGWEVVVPPFIVAVSFLVSAAIGVFFGFYPAWKASRLDPIEALRYE